jgi:hypothetical protein
VKTARPSPCACVCAQLSFPLRVERGVRVGARVAAWRCGNSQPPGALLCGGKGFRTPKVALTQTKIDGYFEAVYRRVPAGISRFIRWLREPSSFAVRFFVAILLIAGGIFSFLPILGIWMLPLGLLLIAQDVPALQKPLVAALMWTEARWKSLKAKWQRSSRSN